MEASSPASPRSGVLVGRKFDPVLHGLPLAFLFCLALAALQLNTLFGLPAHALLVHLPVVLIPLLALAAIAVMVRPEWRRRYGVALAVAALVCLAFTIVAAGAGDALRHDREQALFAANGVPVPPAVKAGGDGGEAAASSALQALGGSTAAEASALASHAALGEQLRTAMIILTAGILGLVLADVVSRRGIGGPLGQAAALLERPRIALAARIGISILAVFTLVWVVRAGHEGAKAVWARDSGSAVTATAPGNAGAAQPPALPASSG